MIQDRDACGKRGEHAAQRHHLNSPRRCRWRRAGVPVRLRGDVFEICGDHEGGTRSGNPAHQIVEDGAAADIHAGCRVPKHQQLGRCARRARKPPSLIAAADVKHVIIPEDIPCLFFHIE